MVKNPKWQKANPFAFYKGDQGGMGLEPVTSRFQVWHPYQCSPILPQKPRVLQATSHTYTLVLSQKAP